MISRSRLGRRTTLAAAALAPALLAACDIDPPREDDPRSEDRAPADADSLLVASVLGEVLAAEAVLAAAAAAAPALRRRLAPVAASHAAHRSLLSEAAPEAVTDPTDPAAPVELGGPRAAVATAVRRSETRLQRTALKACVDASSGDLARVLASLAASTSQHLAALDGGAGAAS